MSEMTLEHTAHHAEAPSPETISNAKMAMWLFLASEVVIFGTLIAVYTVFRFSNPEAVLEVQQELGIGLVSFNTFLLLTSSWAMVMGLREAQKNNPQGLVRWIGLTALLGAAFVGLQAVEYTELAHVGISLDTAYGMRFYAPTAFHGAHVIRGRAVGAAGGDAWPERGLQREEFPGGRNLRPVLALCRCCLAFPVHRHLSDLGAKLWLMKKRIN